MKKIIPFIISLLITLVNCTSCDVLLACMAAGMMGATYPYTNSYTNSTGSYSYSAMPSSTSGDYSSSYSSNSSSSTGYIHAESDLRYYKKMEESVKHNISTLHLYEGSNLVRMKQLIRDEQREMQKTRLEAQRNNFYIEQSPYETISF